MPAAYVVDAGPRNPSFHDPARAEGAEGGKIDIPVPMHVSPCSNLASLSDVGTVTALHTPDWIDRPECESVVLVGCEDGRIFEYTVGSTGAEGHRQVEYANAHDETVTVIASSDLVPLDKVAFSLSHDGTMREWSADADKGGDRFMYKYTGDVGPLLSILLMQDEIYTGTMDGLIVAWHVINRTLLRCYSVSPKPVTSICAYNRLMIVSGSADGHVTLWMRKDGYAVREMRSSDQPVTDLCIDPNGFAFSCSARNPAALPFPEVVRTAKQIKERSEAMLTEGNANLSPRAGGKKRRSQLPIASRTECVSWDLSTGWKEHRFPEDTTCLALHKFSNVGMNLMNDMPESENVGLLVSGHERGMVNVWLTESRSADTLNTMRDLDRWNKELDEAILQLEKLQAVESTLFAEAMQDKNSSRPWFGLGAILTAGQKGMATDNPVGLNLLQNASQPTLHRPLLFQSLREVFRNSIDADPERRWPGLSTLMLHVNAIQLADLLQAIDAVKKQEEVLAVLRERSTALDRNATDLLTKGQLLKTLCGIKVPITCVAACGMNVVAGCADGVATWDLRSGRCREFLHGLVGVPRHVVVKNNVVWAIDAENGVQAWWSALLGTDKQNPAHNRRIAEKPHQYCLLLPDYTERAAKHTRTLPIPHVAHEDSDLQDMWQGLGPTKETATVPLDKFVAYYNALEHCGVGPFSENEIARMMRLKPTAPRQVSYDQFAVCMMRYAAR
eukprot:TRINITY_DN4450_c0_g2_i1.p1 TRINITY_DN4450_c0_g2~~TRINITY_DN4450_c0_g2_i1.p1  ORF type:complete len:737 (+),score=245.36 TRINITY_DN4450_c0_g2_i1:26-2212(+)